MSITFDGSYRMCTGFALSSELYKTDKVRFGVIGETLRAVGRKSFFLLKQKLFTYVLPIH